MGSAQLIQGKSNQSLIEYLQLALAGSLSAWPVAKASNYSGRIRHDTLFLQEPIDGSQEFHAKRRLEAVDNAGRPRQYG